MLSMRTVLTLAMLSFCGALGDVCLAQGMQQVGALPTLHLRALLVLGRTMARNGAVRLALLCMIANFVTLLVVLSWAEVSFIVPATALHFVLATLGRSGYYTSTSVVPGGAGPSWRCWRSRDDEGALSRPQLLTAAVRLFLALSPLGG